MERLCNELCQGTWLFYCDKPGELHLWGSCAMVFCREFGCWKRRVQECWLELVAVTLGFALSIFNFSLRLQFHWLNDTMLVNCACRLWSFAGELGCLNSSAHECVFVLVSLVSCNPNFCMTSICISVAWRALAKSLNAYPNYMVWHSLAYPKYWTTCLRDIFFFVW